MCVPISRIYIVIALKIYISNGGMLYMNYCTWIFKYDGRFVYIKTF